MSETSSNGGGSSTAALRQVAAGSITAMKISPTVVLVLAAIVGPDFFERQAATSAKVLSQLEEVSRELREQETSIRRMHADLEEIGRCE